MLDLHCGNRYSATSGEIDMLQYARHTGLMDSIMMGEGFDAGGAGPCTDPTGGHCGDAVWMMLATSGLQFGAFNDMLTNPNIFRGMVFGMVGRPPYSNAAQNAEVYKFWDSSGLAGDVEIVGFWSGGYGDDWSPVV